jgi:hypothetical protein
VICVPRQQRQPRSMSGGSSSSPIDALEGRSPNIRSPTPSVCRNLALDISKLRHSAGARKARPREEEPVLPVAIGFRLTSQHRFGGSPRGSAHTTHWREPRRTQRPIDDRWLRGRRTWGWNPVLQGGRLPEMHSTRNARTNPTPNTDSPSAPNGAGSTPSCGPGNSRPNHTGDKGNGKHRRKRTLHRVPHSSLPLRARDLIIQWECAFSVLS